MTWTRINPGIMQFGHPNQAPWLVLKIVTKALPSPVTTYQAVLVSADGLLHLGSGDTFKEACGIVDAEINHGLYDNNPERVKV